MSTCPSKSSRIRTQLTPCRKTARGEKQEAPHCCSSSAERSVLKACPLPRRLVSSCPVDVPSGWPQPAPAHSAVHFQTLIAAPWSYCPSQELQGEGTLSPPHTHKSWGPLSFASETSLQPAAAPRGAFLRFSRGLHPSLLTGFPAQDHPLSGTLHRAARALFPKHRRSSAALV